MYTNLNDYVGKKDVNGVLNECIQNNYPHLGILLGKIMRDVGGDGEYHTLLGKLHALVKPTTAPVSALTIPSVPEKKVETKYTKVKLLCNWMTSEGLARVWDKMSRGDFTWNNIKIVWDCEPDYYVIINCPPLDEFNIPTKRCVYIQMEPNMSERKDSWGDWADPDEKLFIKAFKHKDDYNNVEYHLSKTYTELKTMTIQKNPEYDGIISTVLSAKYHDPGHIKRVDFVKFLEQKGMPVHVYGDNRWEYRDFKGSLPYHSKDNGIFPYKYHFMVENHSLKNYFTEKIVDAILGESLCFYSGCFNLKEYLPEQAFVYLELSNFEEDYKVVERAVKEDWYTQRLPAIRQAKRILLDDLGFFPRLERILTEHETQK